MLRPLSEPRLMKPTPTMQVKAATMLNLVGALRWATHTKKGTSTQYTPVRKAFLPGVVKATPQVCR